MLYYASQAVRDDVKKLLAAAAASKTSTKPNQLPIPIPEHEIEPGDSISSSVSDCTAPRLLLYII
jgi:hypothetical protein